MEGGYIGINCNTGESTKESRAFARIFAKLSQELILEVEPHEIDPLAARIVDQEYTAIGCVEQHRFCILDSPMICTAWGRQEDILPDMTKILLKMGYQDAMSDFESLHQPLVLNGTVAEYVRYMGGVAALMCWNGDRLTGIDPNEQWIIELKAWMEASLLKARYMMSNILVKPQDRPREIWNGQNASWSWPCSRIMFLNGDYTNIDFVQLLIIVCCLLSLCALSFESRILAGANKVCTYCGNIISVAVVILREMGQAVLKQLNVACWAVSTPAWPENRRGVADLRPRYPRNPFRGPLYNAHSEEYGLREVRQSATT